MTETSYSIGHTYIPETSGLPVTPLMLGTHTIGEIHAVSKNPTAQAASAVAVASLISAANFALRAGAPDFPSSGEFGACNEDRANWAERALRVFAQTVGMNFDEERSECIGDLIADLMHFCDREGKDFKYLLGVAERNYEEECLEEQELEGGPG